MTRRSLSPVPDAPSGGLDLAEARRNLGIAAAPAALRAVETSARPQAAAEARNRLQRLRGAKQAALEQLEELDSTIGRTETALTRTEVAQATLQRIEAEAAEATRQWIADGARGGAPTLSAAQRQALDAARADLADAQRQRATVEESLATLRTSRQRLAAAVHQADVGIREAAIQIVCAEAHPLLEQLREHRRAVRETELRLLGLREQLSSWGLGVSAAADDLREAFPAAVASVPSPTEAHRAEWSTRLNQLLAGEEE